MLGRINHPHPWSGDPPGAMAMSPDGRWLCSRSLPTGVHWSRYTIRRLALWPRRSATSRPTSCAVDFDPAGPQIAAIDYQTPLVHIFDLRPGKPCMTLAGHSGGLRGIAYSRDGRRLATCGDDETIRVWDAETGTLLHTLRGHVSGVTCVAFSPDNRLIISGGGDSTLRLWSADEGEALIVLHGHSARVNRVAFSDDGRTIASAADDGTARLWDATAAGDGSILRGHTSYVLSGGL